ncbi:hypothetical protein MPTK2_5g21850 [Marchantia polymorpha subsp. ruderalis]
MPGTDSLGVTRMNLMTNRAGRMSTTSRGRLADDKCDFCISLPQSKRTFTYSMAGLFLRLLTVAHWYDFSRQPQRVSRSNLSWQLGM